MKALPSKPSLLCPNGSFPSSCFTLALMCSLLSKGNNFRWDCVAHHLLLVRIELCTSLGPGILRQGQVHPRETLCGAGTWRSMSSGSFLHRLNNPQKAYQTPAGWSIVAVSNTLCFYIVTKHFKIQCWLKSKHASKFCWPQPLQNSQLFASKNRMEMTF